MKGAADILFDHFPVILVQCAPLLSLSARVNIESALWLEQWAIHKRIAESLSSLLIFIMTNRFSAMTKREKREEERLHRCSRSFCQQKKNRDSSFKVSSKKANQGAMRTAVFLRLFPPHSSLLLSSSFNGRLFMYEIYTALWMYINVYLRKNNDGDCDLQRFVYLSINMLSRCN